MARSRFARVTGGQLFHLVAPYESDPQKWSSGTYIELYSSQTYRISTEHYDENTARVRTYREIAHDYIHHPDAKRLDTHGRVCNSDTAGVLSPRHIDAFHVEQLGKEANRLEEVQAGLAHETEDVYTLYQDPLRDPFRVLVLPTLRAMPRNELLAARILEESALREVLAERARPHPETRTRLMNLAVSYARNQLRDTDQLEIRHPLAALYAHLLRQPDAGPEVCARSGCHEPAVEGGRYCGAACRQAAYRSRGR